VKIVCLVKQVPRPDAIEFDPDSNTLRREGVPLLLNPFDATAVATAVALRESVGGEVIAMTMGPPQAEQALRTCLDLGADRCVLLSDRVFAVADTLGTSRTLALALRREGGVDLVLAGRKTVDSETWQVPPELAARLGWPHLTNVVELDARGSLLRVTRETEAGYESYELEAPAVISLAKAREEDGDKAGRIDVWTATDLVDDLRENDQRFGQPGSPTRVLAVRDVTPERARIEAQTGAEAVEHVRALLAERPTGETAWEKPARLGEKPGKSYDAWTLVETIGDRRASRPSLALLAKGRELSGKLGGLNVALLLGHDVEATARSLPGFGAERVVVVDDERLDVYHPDLWSAALVQVLRHYRPHVLAIPATANGRDLAPRAAGELELGMTGDCVNLGIDRAGRLIQTKPAYGGNIVSVIMGRTTPQLATVRAGMFGVLEPREETGRIERFELQPLPAPRLRLVEARPEPAFDLDEEDVVVLLGPDSPRDYSPDGAAVAGTCEASADGRVPDNRHVGLYGRPVAPRVLVAVGVPGDFEQLAGIVKSAVVVAISCGAELEQRADVVFRGDPDEVIPQLADLS
jgi:electron transfer flavoprotein alpha subunit